MLTLQFPDKGQTYLYRKVDEIGVDEHVIRRAESRVMGEEHRRRDLVNLVRFCSLRLCMRHGAGVGVCRQGKHVAVTDGELVAPKVEKLL